MINIYNEEKLSTKDRKELPASIYGLPSEKKYPLNDANHVRSAMAYFNHCDKNKKKELARNIMKAAKKFNVEVSEDSEVYKTLNESYYDDFSAEKITYEEANEKFDIAKDFTSNKDAKNKADKLHTSRTSYAKASCKTDKSFFRESSYF